MMKTILNIKMLFIIITVIVLAGCSHKNTNDNTLLVDISDEPATLDPAIANDWVPFRVINDLFAGLVDFDQTNKPIPGLARSWNISSDGKVYTFYLRDGLKFSNGKPLTAQDVVYSWQRLVNPDTASAYNFLLKDVVNAKSIIQGKLPPSALGIKAIKPNIFVVNLSNPNNLFLSYITSPNTFVVDKEVISKYGSNWTNPKYMVTSGAYKLEDRVTNGYILAAKNPYFYTVAKIDKIKYFPYTDANTALSSFMTDGLDITRENPIDKYQILQRDYPNNLKVWTAERLYFYNINLRLAKYSNNLKLRQALSMAVDRDILVTRVLRSKQTSLYSVVTPTIENGKYADIRYNWSKNSRYSITQTAKRLYNEAGYNGNRQLSVTLKYRNSDIDKKVAVAIATMWHNTLGIKVILKAEEWKMLQQSLRDGDYDIALGGWGADYNAVTTYTHLYQCNDGNNFTSYCNPRYDYLVEKAENTINPNLQQQLFKQALQIVLSDYPIIPLFQPSHQRLVSSRVKNYDVKANYLDNVQSKWMKLENTSLKQQ